MDFVKTKRNRRRRRRRRLNRNLTFIYDADIWVDKKSFGGAAGVDLPFYVVVDNSNVWPDATGSNLPLASPPPLSSLTVGYSLQLSSEFPTPVLPGQCNTRFLHNSFAQTIVAKTPSAGRYLWWSSLCWRREGVAQFLDDPKSAERCVRQLFYDVKQEADVLRSAANLTPLGIKSFQDYAVGTLPSNLTDVLVGFQLAEKSSAFADEVAIVTFGIAATPPTGTTAPTLICNVIGRHPPCVATSDAST